MYFIPNYLLSLLAARLERGPDVRGRGDAGPTAAEAQAISGG